MERYVVVNAAAWHSLIKNSRSMADVDREFLYSKVFFAEIHLQWRTAIIIRFFGVNLIVRRHRCWRRSSFLRNAQDIRS